MLLFTSIRAALQPHEGAEGGNIEMAPFQLSH